MSLASYLCPAFRRCHSALASSHCATKHRCGGLLKLACGEHMHLAARHIIQAVSMREEESPGFVRGETSPGPEEVAYSEHPRNRALLLQWYESSNMSFATSGGWPRLPHRRKPHSAEGIAQESALVLVWLALRGVFGGTPTPIKVWIKC